jgi:hypothetical protein
VREEEFGCDDRRREGNEVEVGDEWGMGQPSTLTTVPAWYTEIYKCFHHRNFPFGTHDCSRFYQSQ